MIDILITAGGLILGMLGFLLEFLGSMCLIALVMIVFVLLTVFIIGMGWVLGTIALDLISTKYSIFDKKGVNENEERNNP